MVSIFEALQQAGKSAIAAKKDLDQRVAKNKENWTATSNVVKDIWGSLDLAPSTFNVQQTVFTCSEEGITNDVPEADAGRNPQTLNELQGIIIEFLDRIRANYDEEMQS